MAVNSAPNRWRGNDESWRELKFKRRPQNGLSWSIPDNVNE